MNLNQITIPVKSVAQSIAFYEKLGFNLIVRSLPHYARLECEIGESTFSLHHVENASSVAGIWIYFEAENLDIKVKDLQQKGFIFDELPTDKPWLWREARLKDLDNNQLIIYYAGDNRKNPPWKISKPVP
jgi:catechol 2,3-dioxygenase-like lactoylglutathione lyase family enzyme